MSNNILEKVLITDNITIKQAMKKLNKNALQILLSIDENSKLIGTVTDGDIRRALLNGVDLNSPINEFVNKNPKFLYQNETGNIKDFMVKHNVAQVPILDNEGIVVDIVFWNDVREQAKYINIEEKDNIVFILAGGKGTRMAPFTKILPKPLIPIGDNPILEIIMDRFKEYGFKKFILSVNYKAEMIKMYFSENPKKYDINYVQEENFLGTAGSLYLIKNKIDKPVIVSNCDVVIDINFNNLLNYHKENKYDITIVGVVQHVTIPYGVIEMKKGKLENIVEKPEYDMVVNSGIYVLNPGIINYIEKEEYLDMPTFINNMKEKKYNIGVYPVNSEWIDIGRWEEYQKAIDKINILKRD